jgi:hypothetical protein
MEEGIELDSANIMGDFDFVEAFNPDLEVHISYFHDLILFVNMKST